MNGLSTSLPIDVQVAYLHAVEGLHRAHLTRPGYAIEYDYYPPQQLTPWLEVKQLRMLFLAGQVNGTTGYEEAAGQGIVAGVSAVRRIQGEEPLVLGRDAAYIGVLIDDLVTRGVDEPYRLFTSRAEFRLLLRQDNALKRLAPLAVRLGLLSADESGEVERRAETEAQLLELASQSRIVPDEVNGLLEAVGERPVAVAQKVVDLVRRPRVSLRDTLLRAVPSLHDVPTETWLSVETEIKYGGYLDRERVAAERLAELTEFRLPPDLPYAELASLRTEARQKLERIRPGSLAQASRVPGVSPSDLQNLVMEVVRRARAVA